MIMRNSRVSLLFTLVIIPLIALGACKDSIVAPELPPADPATVLFVSEFDDENDGVGENNWTALKNYDVVSGCIDLHGNGHFDVQPGNGIYIDMDGTCMDAGTIESKAPYLLEPEETYLFEVWLAGNNRGRPTDTMDVSIGTVYEERFILEADDKFRLYTREINVTEPTEARIRFEHFGGDNHGILVDLIRLRRLE